MLALGSVTRRREEVADEPADHLSPLPPDMLCLYPDGTTLLWIAVWTVSRPSRSDGPRGKRDLNRFRTRNHEHGEHRPIGPLSAAIPSTWDLLDGDRGKRFAPYRQFDVVVEVNGAVSAEVTLRIPQRQENLRVDASDSQQEENSTVELVLNRRLINDLPLVSRNPFDLAFLPPGVSQAPV